MPDDPSRCVFNKGYLLSVDPGFNCGLAVWKDGRLFATGMMIDTSGLNRKMYPFDVVARYQMPDHLMDISFDHYVCEMPEDWGQNSKGSSNDLFPTAALGMLVHAWAGLPPSTAFPVPKHWKSGNIDKAIQNARDMARLTPEETATFQRNKYKNNHVKDSIGVGLWALRRGNK